MRARRVQFWRFPTKRRPLDRHSKAEEAFSTHITETPNQGCLTLTTNRYYTVSSKIGTVRGICKANGIDPLTQVVERPGAEKTSQSPGNNSDTKVFISMDNRPIFRGGTGMDLIGIHHLTAVTARVSENFRFYTEVLGMRLVKRSVNQDDVSAYHLFYADGAGSPGTDLTFFDWNVPREERGTRSIIRTCLRVDGRTALGYWEARLKEYGVKRGELKARDGRLTLEFEDPEGQRLALVDDGGQ